MGNEINFFYLYAKLGEALISLNRRINSLPYFWRGFIVDGTGEVINPLSIQLGGVAYFVIYESLKSEACLSTAPISNFNPLMILKLQKLKLSTFSLCFRTAIKITSLIDNAFKKNNQKPLTTQTNGITDWKVLTPITLNGIERDNIRITTENVSRVLDGRDGFFEWTTSITDNIAYHSTNK